MVHRDSMGIKQKYTEGQVQWMSAGRGIIHEEMWDLQDMADNDIEIYQIWVRAKLHIYIYFHSVVAVCRWCCFWHFCFLPIFSKVMLLLLVGLISVVKYEL